MDPYNVFVALYMLFTYRKYIEYIFTNFLSISLVFN